MGVFSSNHLPPHSYKSPVLTQMYSRLSVAKILLFFLALLFLSTIASANKHSSAEGPVADPFDHYRTVLRSRRLLNFGASGANGDDDLGASGGNGDDSTPAASPDDDNSQAQIPPEAMVGIVVGSCIAGTGLIAAGFIYMRGKASQKSARYDPRVITANGVIPKHPAAGHAKN